MIRRPVPFLALIATVFLLAACGDKAVDERPPETGDVIVARVDGAPIWASDVKREAVAQGLIGEGEPLDLQADLFRQVLDEVIDRELLSAEAAKLKLDEDPMAKRRLAAVRKRVMADMMVERVVGKAVTEENIQNLYREQQKLAADADEYKARQIIVPTQLAAEDIRKLLAAGASFDALAMERSTDRATRFSGGDFGGYFTLDIMSPPYQSALREAQPGQLIGPFAVEGGWALVRVDDKRKEAPISLEAARPLIVRLLTYGQIRDLLERERSGAKIEILLPKSAPVPGRPSEPANAPLAGAAPPPAAPAPAPSLPPPTDKSKAPKTP